MGVRKAGQLIVVEGASDGIGKTTQFKLLIEHFKKDLGTTQVINHHFPTYYSYQGKGVEKYLSGDYGEPSELSPYFINNLYAYDRMISWFSQLKPQFEKGRTILLDRYTTSSLIYQSALLEGLMAKKKFLDYVEDFEYDKLGIRRPDKVIFLHAPLDLVTKMRNARKTNEGEIENDIHEHNLDFMKKVYDNAMFVAEYLGWSMVDCANTKKDEMLTPEEIHEKIYKLLNQK